MGAAADARSLCPFREEAARCVLVDGHPGCHVCVRPHSPGVKVRGEGEIPDVRYLRPAPDERTRTDARHEAGLVSGEDVLGAWTLPMLQHLIEEIRDAGVVPPRDWPANLPRLRREAGDDLGAAPD